MKILVALDMSPFAERIIDALVTRRWPRGTEFFLLNVVERTTGWFSAADYDVAEACSDSVPRRQEYMKQLAMRLKRRLPEHEIFSEVVPGSPSEQIVSTARRLDVDLIVIGQQGTAGASGLSLGGVAESVVHKSHCSVEVVKPKVEVRQVGAAQRSQVSMVV